MINPKMKADSSEQSIRVEIYNQTYSIRSDGDNEYIMHLAEYVDGKMREISSGTLTVDSLKVAILAALHIADDRGTVVWKEAVCPFSLTTTSTFWPGFRFTLLP